MEPKSESKLKEHIGFALLFLIILIAGIILISDKENPVKDNVQTQAEINTPKAETNEVKAATTETKPTRVNINTASIEDLDTLPGIGEVTAQKIIDYRTKKGRFKTIESIMDVSGIGEAKFGKIKNLISI